MTPATTSVVNIRHRLGISFNMSPSTTPGSSQYLPSLLGYVRRHHPDLDARLFTSILLSLIAGERNLLVRTEENDIADVATAAVDVRLGP